MVLYTHAVRLNTLYNTVWCFVNNNLVCLCIYINARVVCFIQVLHYTGLKYFSEIHAHYIYSAVYRVADTRLYSCCSCTRTRDREPTSPRCMRIGDIQTKFVRLPEFRATRISIDVFDDCDATIHNNINIVYKSNLLSNSHR